MEVPGLKLTVYLGDRDRSGGGLLADALMELFAREKVGMSVLLRGMEGYGLEHHLRTERLLTLSEDLPLLAVAMDGSERINALARAVQEMAPRGAIALERVRLLAGEAGPSAAGAAGASAAGAAPGEAPARVAGSEAAARVADGEASAVGGPSGGQAQLTVFLARGHRVSGAPAYEWAIARMHGHGLYGANMLLGLDGTVAGERQRARFLSRNPAVPSMIVAVGEAERVAGALADLRERLGAPTALERVQVCKRDGALLSRPQAPPAPEADGPAFWQKLVVYTGEQARHGGEPLHETLVRRLREAGAAGATTMRGVWGFHGDHAPHGERLLSLGRHTPLLTMVLDSAEKTQRWFEIVDELTSQVGLVTCENVPALRAAATGGSRGGLSLAGSGAGAA